MKHLYRLVVNGWWPVVLDEAEVGTMHKEELQELYEDCEVNAYDFDGLVLRLERASAADVAKYGEDEA